MGRGVDRRTKAIQENRRRIKSKRVNKTGSSLLKEPLPDQALSYYLRRKIADRVTDHMTTLFPELHDYLASGNYDAIEQNLQGINLEGLFLQPNPSNQHAFLGHYYYLWAKVYEHKQQYAKAACAYAKLKFYSCKGRPSLAMKLPAPKEMTEIELMDFAIYQCRALFQKSHPIRLNLQVAQELGRKLNTNKEKLLEWVVQCKFILSGNEFNQYDLSPLINRYLMYVASDFFNELDDVEKDAFKKLFREMVMFSPFCVSNICD